MRCRLHAARRHVRVVLGRWYGTQGLAEGGREEPRLAQDEEITQIQNKYKSQKQDPSSSSTSPTPSNPQASPSTGTINVDVNVEDNAKCSIESANDERVDERHGGGIDVMKSGIDVSEIYIPHQVVNAAQRLGPRPGCSMDIKTQDFDGRHWDFEKEMRNRAIRKIADETPFVLITSAMCSDWHIMTNATWKSIGLAEMEKRMNRVGMHLDFVCTLHLIQHRAGRYLRPQTTETSKFVESDVRQGSGSKNQRGVHQRGPASVRLEADVWRGGASKEEQPSRATRGRSRCS